MDIIEDASYTYLIFDVVDECGDTTHRKEFLRIVYRLSQHRTSRILITSRPHIQDVCDALRNHPQVVIEAEDNIKSYLHKKLI